MAEQKTPIYVSYKAASSETGLSQWALRKMVWSGQLPVLKIGNKHYLDRRDLERIIAQKKERYREPPESVFGLPRLERFEKIKREKRSSRRQK